MAKPSHTCLVKLRGFLVKLRGFLVKLRGQVGTLPETNSSHLLGSHPERKRGRIQPPFFGGENVSFREGNCK